MKKRIIAVIASLSLAAVSSAAVMADDAIKVLVNNQEVQFQDAAPFIENDRTLVPMRAIFEALGADVMWDGNTKSIISYDPASDISVTMQIDSDTMFVGETAVTLDVPAKIVNDRTVVPLRAVSEGMKAAVNWDGATRTITVEK